jgi:hypothetical protein
MKTGLFFLSAAALVLAASTGFASDNAAAPIGQPTIFWHDNEWQTYENGVWRPYGRKPVEPLAGDQADSEEIPQAPVFPEDAPSFEPGADMFIIRGGHNRHSGAQDRRHRSNHNNHNHPFHSERPRSALERFRNQESPAAGMGAPNVFIGQPNIGIGQPTIGIGQPTIGIGQPTIGIGQPTIGIGQPTIGIGQPTIGIGQPTIGIGQRNGIGANSTVIGAPNTSIGQPNVVIGRTTIEMGRRAGAESRSGNSGSSHRKSAKGD